MRVLYAVCVLLLCVSGSFGSAREWNRLKDDTVEQMKYVNSICHVLKSFTNLTGPVGDMFKEEKEMNETYLAIIESFENVTSPVVGLMEEYSDLNMTLIMLKEQLGMFLNETMGDMKEELGDIVHVLLNMTQLIEGMDDDFDEVLSGARDLLGGMVGMDSDDIMSSMMGDMEDEMGHLMCSVLDGSSELSKEMLGNGLIGGGQGGMVGMYMMGVADWGMDTIDGASGMLDSLLEVAEVVGCPNDMGGIIGKFGNMTGNWYDMVGMMESFIDMTGSIRADEAMKNMMFDKLQMVAFMANISETIGNTGGGPGQNVSRIVTSMMMGDMDGMENALMALEKSINGGNMGSLGGVVSKMNQTANLIEEVLGNPDGIVEGLVNNEQNLMDALMGLKDDMDGMMDDVGETVDAAVGTLEERSGQLMESMLSMGENAMGVMMKQVMVSFRNMSRPWEKMKSDMDEFFESTESMGGLFGCNADLSKKVGNSASDWMEDITMNNTVIYEFDSFVKMVAEMLEEHGDIIFDESMQYVGAVSHLTKYMQHHMSKWFGSMADSIGCDLNITTAGGAPDGEDSWPDLTEFKSLLGDMTQEMGHKFGIMVGHQCNMVKLEQMMVILMRQNLMQMHIAEIQAIQANMFEMMWMYAESSFDHFLNSEGLSNFGEFMAGDIPDSVMEMMTPDFFRKMSPDMMSIFARHMKPHNRDTLCFSMIRYGDTQLLNQMMRAGIDCLSAIANDPTVKIDDGAAHELLNTLKEQGNPADWGRSDWETALRVPSALIPSDIKGMDTSVMKDLVQAGAIALDTFDDNPSGQKAFNNRLKDAYGNPDSWTTSDLAELGGHLVANLDINDMKDLDAAAIGATLEKYKNVTFSDRKKESAFAAKVVEGLGGVSSASSWSTSDIENSAKYCLKNPRVLAGLSDDNLLEAIEAFDDYVEDKKDAVTLARKLASLSDYADPSALSTNDLMSLGKTMSGFPPSFTDSLSGAALAGSVDSLSAGDYPRGQARTLMNKLKNRGVFDPSAMSSSDVARAGTLLAGLDSDELASIPPAAINQSLQVLGDLDLSEDQGRTLVTQLKSLMGGNFASTQMTFPAKTMKKLFKYLSRSELMDVVSSGHLDMDCSGGDPLDIDVDATQALTIMTNIKSMFGSLGNTNTNYSTQCFLVWGKVSAMGFTAQDFEDLREDDELVPILAQLKDYEMEMEESQTLAIAAKLRRTYANSTMAASLDDGTATQIGPFMKHLTDSEFDGFNMSVRPTICRGLSQASTKRMSRNEMQRLKRFCLRNVQSDDTDDVMDRTDAASREDSDITVLGKLTCGLETSDMEKLTLEAIENNLQMMAKCVYSMETGKALVDRAMSLHSSFLESTDNLIGAGHVLNYLSDADIDTIPMDTLAEAFLDLADSFDEFDTILNERSVAYGIEYDTAQRDTENAARDRLFQRALDALSDSGINARRRRSLRARRATNPVTCADVQSMGGSVTSLSASDISAMDGTEFTDCLETLGGYSSWSDEQLTALADQAKSTLGAVNTWSAEETRQVGSIVAGLSSAEIDTLALSSSDVMTSVGQHDIYDSAQLASGYARWLSLTQSDSVSNVDADELNAIGHFACGIDTSEIASISASVYIDAASSIGSLTTCEETQLAAYAALAKHSSAFGDVTSWDGSTIATVGGVMGGLTKPEISSLTQTQIQSITPNAMSQMPPSNFAGFSSTQISYFSTSQASAVTASQQAALDSEQLQALVDAGATQQVVLDSASALAPFSALLFIVSFLAIRL